MEKENITITETKEPLAPCPWCGSIPVMLRCVETRGHSTGLHPEKNPSQDPEHVYPQNVDHWEEYQTKLGNTRYRYFQYRFRVKCQTPGCIGGRITLYEPDADTLVKKWNYRHSDICNTENE